MEHQDEAHKLIEMIKKWDIDQYITTGRYALPLHIREKIEELKNENN
jgi:hypothetical protein